MGGFTDTSSEQGAIEMKLDCQHFQCTTFLLQIEERNKNRSPYETSTLLICDPCSWFPHNLEISCIDI